jgi:hypothetical protein
MHSPDGFSDNNVLAESLKRFTLPHDRRSIAKEKEEGETVLVEREKTELEASLLSRTARARLCV